MSNAGYLADPLSLAQRLMEKLQVDLNDPNSEDQLPSEMFTFYMKRAELTYVAKESFLNQNPGSNQFRNINNATGVKPSCLRVSL